MSLDTLTFVLLCSSATANLRQQSQGNNHCISNQTVFIPSSVKGRSRAPFPIQAETRNRKLARGRKVKMVQVLDTRLLALTGIVTCSYQTLFFFITYAFRFDTLTDFAGSTNFIVLALITLTVGGHYFVRQVVLSAFVFLWGFRLGGFLLYRILSWGEDRRFDDKRENFLQLSIFWMLQALWVWTVSLPITITNASSFNPPLTTADYIGWTLFAAGLLLEAVADWQKLVFKNTPASQGRWTDVGVWSWSRHPNYFGEIVLWWGLYVSSTSVLRGAEHLAVLGPLFITFILLFLSGIPILEKGADKKHATKADYIAYKRRTSVLVPVPPSLYDKVPSALKRTLFLDFPIYNSPKRTSEGNDQQQSLN